MKNKELTKKISRQQKFKFSDLVNQKPNLKTNIMTN